MNINLAITEYFNDGEFIDSSLYNLINDNGFTGNEYALFDELLADYEAGYISPEDFREDVVYLYEEGGELDPKL